MDPITALGVAGSVVGIAGFGVQLSEFLTTYFNDYKNAQKGLKSTISKITDMTRVLHQIQDLLDKEVEARKVFHRPVVFSDQALQDLENTTEACLLIYLKISVTIASSQKSEKVIDEDVEEKIAAAQKKNGKARCPRPEPLNKDALLKGAQRMKWPVVASRFRDWNKELAEKTSLISLLILTTILSAKMDQGLRTIDDIQKYNEITRQARNKVRDAGKEVERLGLERSKYDQPITLPDEAPSSKSSSSNALRAIPPATDNNMPDFPGDNTSKKAVGYSYITNNQILKTPSTRGSQPADILNDGLAQDRRNVNHRTTPQSSSSSLFFSRSSFNEPDEIPGNSTAAEIGDYQAVERLRAFLFEPSLDAYISRHFQSEQRDNRDRLPFISSENLWESPAITEQLVSLEAMKEQIIKLSDTSVFDRMAALPLSHSRSIWAYQRTLMSNGNERRFVRLTWNVEQIKSYRHICLKRQHGARLFPSLHIYRILVFFKRGWNSIQLQSGNVALSLPRSRMRIVGPQESEARDHHLRTTPWDLFGQRRTNTISPPLQPSDVLQDFGLDRISSNSLRDEVGTTDVEDYNRGSQDDDYQMVQELLHRWIPSQPDENPKEKDDIDEHDNPPSTWSASSAVI